MTTCRYGSFDQQQAGKERMQLTNNTDLSSFGVMTDKWSLISGHFLRTSAKYETKVTSKCGGFFLRGGRWFLNFLKSFIAVNKSSSSPSPTSDIYEEYLNDSTSGKYPFHRLELAPNHGCNDQCQCYRFPLLETQISHFTPFIRSAIRFLH